jgi:hypothetical protein
MEAFTRANIYTDMSRLEAEGDVFRTWLGTLDYHTYTGQRDRDLGTQDSAGEGGSGSEGDADAKADDG